MIDLHAIKIPLTKGRMALIDESMKHLADYKWYYWEQRPDNFYAAKAVKCLDGKWRGTRMHHFIIGYPVNGKQVDHINRNSLDNRLANLRIVDARENSRNRKFKNKKSKYTGVSLSRNIKKWVARICVNGKSRVIGNFYTQKEAAQAYETEILKLKSHKESK